MNRKGRESVPKAERSKGQNSEKVFSGAPVFSSVGDTAAEQEMGFLRKHLVVLAIVAALILIALAYVLAPRMLSSSRSKGKPSVVSADRPNPNTEVTAVQPTSSLEEIRQRAVQGDPQAQFAIGLRYAVGENEPQDYGIAARWFLKAVEQGLVLAQDNLGAYYWAGRGVPKDVVKAYYWSSVAKEAGNAASEVRVQFLTPQLTHEQAAAIQRQAAEFYKQHPPIKTESSR